MNILQLLSDLFTDYTLRTVALGAAVLGMVSGALGAHAVLRRQSLLGDAISHAALPGVVLAFLITRSKAPLALLLGAALTGWLATLLMMAVVRRSRIKEDTALGISLSVFFGLGLVLLTFTQRLPDSRQAGLDHFLFGQAAALLQSDVVVMAALGGVALALLAVFWKEFKLITFDREYAASLGLPVSLLDLLLTSLLVIAIVIGLQAVGVVLMSAMVVAPAAAARQWTNRLGVMVLLAGGLGALAGVGGTLVSSLAPGLSTGPTIVLSATLIVVASLLLAPQRGLMRRWLDETRNHRRLRVDAMLADLYELALEHHDPAHAHALSALQVMHPGSGARATLQVMAERGWAESTPDGQWRLTEAGTHEAQSRAEIGIASTKEGQHGHHQS